MNPFRRLPWIGAGFVVAVAAAAGESTAPDAGFQLTVLGIAQDGGVPHLGCDRPCCREARARGTALLPACLGIRDLASGRLVLVEATPSVETQIRTWHEALGVSRGRAPVDAVLLTHAHIGHYLGLAQFGREAASVSRLPVHASPRLAAFLRGNGPWSQLVTLEQVDLRVFTPGEAFHPVEGLTVIARPVPHRDEFSDTVALTFQGPRATVLFVPDVDAWDRHPGLLDTLLAGVDIAYLDATFYDGRELPDRSLAEIPHPLMVDTMERLAARAQTRPGSLRFIHLNHTNPALWDPGIRARIESRGFRIASEGETVDL
jgi:pyrroloquinoline quinone biosynthesis protein B